MAVENQSNRKQYLFRCLSAHKSTTRTSLELNLGSRSAKLETTCLSHGTGSNLERFSQRRTSMMLRFGLRHTGVLCQVVTNASEEQNAAFFKVKDS